MLANGKLETYIQKMVQFLGNAKNVKYKWEGTRKGEIMDSSLHTGAKCEANTFDGERCMYGSLNDSIRRLLKEYKCITAKTMQRDYYDHFLNM